MPGHGLDEINCMLSHEALGPNTPPYEALSYTWGSGYSLQCITLNGTPFHVTKNLEAALRHLRKPYETRLVWMDAISINQDDDIERGQQVQLMRRIYTLAKQVIVWLGEESSRSKLAMEFFESANDNHDMREWFRDTIVKTTQGLYKEEWKAVFNLFERGYWERIWIVQELACAAKIDVLCGSHSARWGVLITCQSAWYGMEQSSISDVVRSSMHSIKLGRKKIKGR